ncbi:Virulence factors putative positive transcription regulator BvgA [compost metagenome]
MEMIGLLSDRELSVLQQLSRGMSNKAIAENLMLSSKTVSCYKARLIDKLGVKSVVDLADLARRNKLI